MPWEYDMAVAQEAEEREALQTSAAAPLPDLQKPPAPFMRLRTTREPRKPLTRIHATILIFPHVVTWVWGTIGASLADARGIVVAGVAITGIAAFIAHIMWIDSKPTS